MKKKFLIVAITGLMCGSIFTACKSPEEKLENASENVSEARQDLSEAEQEYNQEWENFKRDYEARIQTNESDIASYREMERTDKSYRTKYKARIDELEARNTAMKERINAYEAEKRKDNWREFKEEFKHDMEELGNAFRDFGKDNK